MAKKKAEPTAPEVASPVYRKCRECDLTLPEDAGDKCPHCGADS